MSQEEKHKRVAQMTKLSDEKLRDFSKSFFGTRRLVLWEHPGEAGDGVMFGHTDNYLRVCAKASPSLYNTVSPVLLTGFYNGDSETLIGVME